MEHILDFETFVNHLDEGLIKTYPIDKVVSYIQRTLQLTDEDIDIDYEYKSDCIDVGKHLNQDIIDKIDKILSMSGYFEMDSDENIHYYFKKYDDDVFEKLKSENKIKYLYHITPSKNDNKIQKIGLIPTHKNDKYNYPERVYLLSDEKLTNKISFFKRFAEHLQERSKKEYDCYSVYQVDFSKLKDIKLFISPTAYNYDAYFTVDNIHPDYLEKIYEIHL